VRLFQYCAHFNTWKGKRCMTRKSYLLNILENLEKNIGLFPSDLQQTIREVKKFVQDSPDETFYMTTNHVVSQPAGQQTFAPRYDLYQLTERYSELKRIAEQNQAAHPELLSAVNQLRGLFEASEGYFPE